MAMTLYHGEPNGPSFTVLATLFEKGFDLELRRIDLTSGERHRLPFANQTEVALSLEGEGPVLVVDGEPLADSLFISLYLDETNPANPLRPEGPYGHWALNSWCRFIAERVAPAAALLGTRAYLAPRLAGRDGAVTDEAIARVPSNDLRDRWQCVRANDFPEARVADSHAKIRLAVERIEQALADGNWILDRFSLADLETYAWLASMPNLSHAAFIGAPLTMEWLKRVKSRPAVQRALALATVDEPLQIWAPGPEINRWG